MATIHRPVSANVVRPIGVVSNVTKTGRISTQAATASGQYGHANLTQATMGNVSENNFMDDSPRTIAVSGNIGNTELVAGISNKQFLISDYTLVTSAAAVVKIQSSGTLIAGPMSFGANGGASSENINITTAVGQPIVLNTTASWVGGHLTYRIM